MSSPTTADERALARARAAAAEVLDPELPALTLVDLGILRDVTIVDGVPQITITPTYSGCPALEAMRDDLRDRLAAAGFPQARIRTVLSPAWTTDWITERGRAKLADYGIAPPTRRASTGPIPLRLDAPAPTVPCPRCGARNTRLLSRFSATACKSLRQCPECREPFEHFKEH